MIIQCNSCSRKFVVQDQAIPKEGRTVQCGYCSVSWHQLPISTKVKAEKVTEKIIEKDESPSVDSIKASDGKTYKFLGSQWAELLPSGKTGLFARKKIGQELDKITGRKVRRTPKKKSKKIEEVNPSSANLETDRFSSASNNAKQGIGFFGYIFLIIIIGFSLVGILKTFENDLITNFPEIEYIYEILNQQLIYISETVKNLITIFKDLINSY
tara:strand:- start:150 stop:788 length:639 start_codon:yes stop_codon:yes gene_type:complete